jgi:transcriptional regulator with XRE-family HTH domain
MDDLSTISGRLKHARKARKKSQAEVAEFINVGESAYGHYERGRNEFSQEAGLKISEFLKISHNWLLTGNGPMIEVEYTQDPVELLLNALDNAKPIFEHGSVQYQIEGLEKTLKDLKGKE